MSAASPSSSAVSILQMPTQIFIQIRWSLVNPIKLFIKVHLWYLFCLLYKRLRFFDRDSLSFSALYRSSAANTLIVTTHPPFDFFTQPLHLTASFDFFIQSLRPAPRLSPWFQAVAFDHLHGKSKIHLCSRPKRAVGDLRGLLILSPTSFRWQIQTSLWFRWSAND